MSTVRFTEEMMGYVAFGAADFVAGHAEGRRSSTRFLFHLTISVDDLARFRADPLHEAEATGWIECPALSLDNLPVERGWFNLFAPGAVASRTTMRYRLHFADVAGNPLTMVGFKDVGDDPGLDLWSDTTSLYTTLLDGHVGPDQAGPAAGIPGTGGESGPAPNVRARGILVIPMRSFARQLTTFRGDPAGVAGFALDFGRALWRTFAGRSGGRR